VKKIEWDSSFLLGFHNIDTHHQHLIELLSKTHEEFVAGAPNLGPILNELIAYTRYHFESEELWMLDGQYPGITEHKKEHYFFLQKTQELQRDYHCRSENLFMEMLLFLEKWITNHILKTDADFGRFLSQRPHH
jgi:hemerythrin